MKRRAGRIWRWLLVLSATGALFQLGGIGFTRNGFGGNCQGLNFYENGLLTSVDFCYLLDCQNGFLGGAIKPCGPSGFSGDNLLVDCPTTIVTFENNDNANAPANP